MVDPIPMQIPAGYGLFTAVFKSIYGPKQYTINMGFKTTLAPGQNPAAEIWGLFDNTANPFAPAAYTDRYIVEKTHALYQDDVDLLVFDHPVNVAGTGTWESCPTNVAVLVQKKTGRGGRNQRGRMYVPPTVVSEANVDTLGVIATTPLNAMQARWDALMTDFDASDYTPYLLHGGTKANPSVAPLPTEITSFLVESIVATQRRRLR